MRCADFWHHHALMMLSRFSRFCRYSIRLFSRHSLVKHAAIVAGSSCAAYRESSDRDKILPVELIALKLPSLNALNALGGVSLVKCLFCSNLRHNEKGFPFLVGNFEFSWTDSKSSGRWHHGRAANSEHFLMG